jgi:hypothetical protein
MYARHAQGQNFDADPDPQHWSGGSNAAVNQMRHGAAKTAEEQTRPGAAQAA